MTTPSNENPTCFSMSDFFIGLIGKYKKMNIDDFIISSKILLEKGQFESALCLICCAIDACANSKYSNIKGNKNRISNFLNEYMSIITQFGMPVRSIKNASFNLEKISKA